MYLQISQAEEDEKNQRKVEDENCVELLETAPMNVTAAAAAAGVEQVVSSSNDDAFFRLVRSRVVLGISLFLNVTLVLLVNGILLRNNNNTNMGTALISSSPVSTQQQGWVRPPVVYGLVHIAKTAGSEINGNLSMHYERVCGNKGYSYDAYFVNERSKDVLLHAKTGKEKKSARADDSLHELFPSYDRGNPSRKWMDEVGFQDCDYVAMETHVIQEWDHILRQTRANPMEMHVPCRDPIDHLMSQCNHFHNPFDCSDDEATLQSQIDTCILGVNDRFSPWLQHHANVTLKCFASLPPSRYVDYMGQFLQRKRIETDYVYRPTNTPRDHDSECIWQTSEAYQERIRQLLRRLYPYYQFCHDCMGSPDELPL